MTSLSHAPAAVQSDEFRVELFDWDPARELYVPTSQPGRDYFLLTMTAWDEAHAPTSPCHPDSIDWELYWADREAAERDYFAADCPDLDPADVA